MKTYLKMQTQVTHCSIIDLLLSVPTLTDLIANYRLLCLFKRQLIYKFLNLVQRTKLTTDFFCFAFVFL